MESVANRAVTGKELFSFGSEKYEDPLSIAGLTSLRRRIPSDYSTI